MRGYSFSELVKLSEGAIKRSGDTATGNLAAPKFLLTAPQAEEPNSVVRRDFFDSTVAGLNVENNTMKLGIWEALRRSYAEAGYNVVGTFQEGFTYVNANDVGIDLATWKGYTGPAGNVAAETNPASSGFVDVSASLLRDYVLNTTAATFKNERGYSAVANMIAGRVKGIAGAVVHKAGNIYSTGGTTWGCLVDGASSINHFKSLNGLYASDFADTLNEAMDAINSYFTQRVTIVVPALMRISDTVAPTVDCDFIIQSAELTQNLVLKPVFKPANGWSGTCTPHYIDGKNFSALRGWELNGEGYGVINLNNPEFRNFGNKDTNTSDSSWKGFDLINNNGGSITLINPTCRDIYVKPNSIIGDVPGTCRCVMVSGKFNAGDVATDINIHGFTAINLLTEEDSDAVVVECTSDDLTEVSLNVDIYSGHAYNCQKRMFKFQTPLTNLRGIRLHGSFYAHAGDSVKAISPLSVQPNISLDANCLIIYEGRWTFGLDADDCVIRGNLEMQAKASSELFIQGNTTRYLYLRNGADVQAKGFKGFGHNVALSVDGTSRLICDYIDVSRNSKAGTIAGYLKASKVDITSSGTQDLTGEQGSLIITGEVEITESCNISNLGNTLPPIQNYRIATSKPVSIARMTGDGASLLMCSVFECSGNLEFIRPKSKYGNAVIRFTGASGNVFIDGGQHPASVTTRAAGASVAKLIQVNDRIY